MRYSLRPRGPMSVTSMSPLSASLLSELHFFGYGNIFEPHVTYHRAEASGELTINRPLDVPALTMMHDFAMTAGHVVFMDLPVVFDVEIMKSAGRDMPFRWDDDY